MLFSNVFNGNIWKKISKSVYLQRKKSQKGVKYGRAKISKRCGWHRNEAESLSATP